MSSTKIDELYIEKDYWLTYALWKMFTSDIVDQAVFKGGTALAKCYKLIDRFSEDIDIVALKNQGETGPLPTETAIKENLMNIGDRLQQVNWQLAA